MRVVMGTQQVGDVTLIRNADVRSSRQHHDICSLLLAPLLDSAPGSVFIGTGIGTWVHASQVVHFYEKHGVKTVKPKYEVELPKRYRAVSDRHLPF